MSAIRLLCLALLAVSQVTGGRLDSKRSVLHASSFLCRQLSVAIGYIERRSGVGEYGRGVAPIEHQIEEEAERRRAFACMYGQCDGSKAWLDRCITRRPESWNPRHPLPLSKCAGGRQEGLGGRWMRPWRRAKEMRPTCPTVLGGVEADAYFYPTGP